MEQKYALVTGSSSGIGLEMCHALLDENYIVLGGSRSDSSIDHEHFYDIELDMTSPDSMEEFFETVAEFTDSLHLVVNNAGICTMSSLQETSIEDFEDQLATNTLGPFLLFQKMESFIVNDETHVISILSTAAHFGYPNVSAYTASKFGQLGLIESIKKEWKDYGVRFTNLFPGAIDTPLWDKLGSRFSRDKMLKTSDFISLFKYLINAPSSMQFPEITFLHKDGFLE